jgi:hypothetical protein
MHIQPLRDDALELVGARDVKNRPDRSCERRGDSPETVGGWQRVPQQLSAGTLRKRAHGAAIEMEEIEHHERRGVVAGH